MKCHTCVVKEQRFLVSCVLHLVFLTSLGLFSFHLFSAFALLQASFCLMCVVAIFLGSTCRLNSTCIRIGLSTIPEHYVPTHRRVLRYWQNPLSAFKKCVNTHILLSPLKYSLLCIVSWSCECILFRFYSSSSLKFLFPFRRQDTFLVFLFCFVFMLRLDFIYWSAGKEIGMSDSEKRIVLPISLFTIVKKRTATVLYKGTQAFRILVHLPLYPHA